MDLSDLIGRIDRCFDQLRIPYLMTGGIASIAYGEPRLTINIDVVADLREDQVGGVKACFPEDDFYLDIDAARQAIRRKGQFNIIHPASGFKIDVIIAKKDAFDKSRFRRIRRLKPAEEIDANFASPEDVIIKKMEYYAEGKSDKHLRDIAGILKISGASVDLPYIETWVEKLSLHEVWTLINKNLGKKVKADKSDERFRRGSGSCRPLRAGGSGSGRRRS
jgi:hypothetical protein